MLLSILKTINGLKAKNKSKSKKNEISNESLKKLNGDWNRLIKITIETKLVKILDKSTIDNAKLFVYKRDKTALTTKKVNNLNNQELKKINLIDLI